MTSNERIEKIVTSDLGKAIKPPAMTPIPIVSGEDRGLKSPPMTPIQPANPAPAQAPAVPVQTPKNEVG
jgi:hypothetical protein